MALANPEDPTGVLAEWWDKFTDPPGYRAEVVRGELVLSPSPSRVHQRAVTRLLAVLAAACPEGFEAIPDIEWRLDRHGLVAQAPRPDIVITTISDEPIDEPPLLAVEVLSPSDTKPLERSSMVRIGGKQLDYAENGLRHLLIISTVVPFAHLLGLDAAATRSIAFAENEEHLEVDEPFSFAFRPVDLLG